MGVYEPLPAPAPVEPVPAPQLEPQPFVPSPVPPVVGPTETPEPEPEYGAPEALPDLGWLAKLIIILGLALLAGVLVDAINKLARLFFSHFFPPGTDAIPNKHAFVQSLSNTLGTELLGFDADLGVSFTKLAEVAASIGEAILAGEATVAQVAERLVGLEALGGSRIAADAATATRVGKAQATADAAAQSAAAASAAAAATSAATNGKVDGLTEHVTHLIEPELDGLRHAIPNLEKGLQDAWDLIRKHDEALSIAGVTAATAVALTRLGADWTECEYNQQIGRSMCGGAGSSLARLLEGALPLLAFGDLCAVLQGATALATSTPVRDSLSFGADAIAGLLACTGSEGAPPLLTAYFAPGAETAIGAPGAVAAAT